MPHRSSKVFIFTDTDLGGVIHVANIKGGVGKSTVATNLAAALSRRGPVLLIDLDAQGSATHAFGKDPDEFTFSSFDLFRKRFSAENVGGVKRQKSDDFSIRRFVSAVEAGIAGRIMGKGDITELRARIQPCLDLIPANSQLFNEVRFYHMQNFLFNLDILRNYYKYVVLDTPSVWNHVTRTLYAHSDLNLIPVTLSALSTKSLRDYLVRVKNLADHNHNVRVRIVKNEVFGTQESKIKGKTRTMSENRRFLEQLCEQILIHSEGGISSLPQTVMFDLEIPESATVRDAQDEGKPVQEYQRYSAIARAFEELAKRVQYVLNTQGARAAGRIVDAVESWYRRAFRFAAACVLLAIMGLNHAVFHDNAPRPIAPQQLALADQEIITHAFQSGESIYKIAKYAICKFRAVVPSYHEVNNYIRETVDIYNKTRVPGEPKVADVDRVPADAVIQFYPPFSIVNPRQKELQPVYDFFAGCVKDRYAYVTGDWCFRGSGGGTPHYGIDVAANLGCKILSPIDGIAQLNDSKSAGRSVGIVKEGTVIFFSHLDRRIVKSGEQVHKGDVIGTVGMTGNTTGPHAHVGYGVKSPASDGIQFGSSRYKVTDPKLFFYRLAYVNSLGK